MSSALMQATFAAAAQVLAPPFQQLTTNAYTTVMRGAYRGYVAQVDFQYPRDEREVESVSVSVIAATHGVVLRVRGRSSRPTIVLNRTPGERPKGVAEILAWDPAFRERFTVGGRVTSSGSFRRSRRERCRARPCTR